MPLTLPDFTSRHHEEEWMDQPETSRRDFMRALCEIQWVNRTLGGIQALLETLVPLLPPPRPDEPIRILDLGTGSADIPRALVDWGRQHGARFEVLAMDLHPLAVEAARGTCRDYPEITVMQGNALYLDLPDRTADWTISSMFMHHLDDEQAVRLLTEMARLSRYGLIVNDLERHPMAWLGIQALGILTNKGPVFRNDAPLSVRRAFTGPELQELADEAGLPGARIRHHHPFRWTFTWEHPH